MNTCMKYSINLCIVQYIMEPQAIMNPERATYESITSMSYKMHVVLEILIPYWLRFFVYIS